MKSFLSINLGELAPPSGRILPEAGYVRDLIEDDLVLLSQTRSHGIKNHTTLDEMRFVHHNAARLLAIGWKVADISVATGLAPNTIHSLVSDPSFEDLVAHYAQNEREAVVDVRARMVQLGLCASEELQKRVTTTPDVVTNKDLLGILQVALDRGGHAPVQRQATVNLSLTSEELAIIKGAIAQGKTDG